MAKRRLISPAFPFKNSVDGFFVDMNKTTKDAIKSSLMHLITTRKGERYYLPDFGTDLMRFIFEPNDGITEAAIIEDIKTTVSLYIPKLKVNSVTITRDDEIGYTAKVRIDYTVSEDVFESTDFVIINI